MNASKNLTVKGRDREADLHKLTVAWIEGLEWENCEYGGWVVDPKRPFGNSGRESIAQDILEIIGADREPTCAHCGAVDDKAIGALMEYAHDLFQAIPERLKKLAQVTP